MTKDIEMVSVPADALLTIIHHIYEESERGRGAPMIGEAVDALFAAYQAMRREKQPVVDVDSIPF